MITANLPNKENYGLISQLQRSATSIPSNIAEGSKRSSRPDFRNFCMVALGSAAEVETQLLIVQGQYSNIPVNRALDLVIEVQKMLTSLSSKLKT